MEGEYRANEEAERKEELEIALGKYLPATSSLNWNPLSFFSLVFQAPALFCSFKTRVPFDGVLQRSGGAEEVDGAEGNLH